MISLICVVSAAIQTGSVHIAMFLVGRFLNGIGVGMMDVSVPIYQSEVSPARSRGRMVGSHGFLVVVGYVSGDNIPFSFVQRSNVTVHYRLLPDGLAMVAFSLQTKSYNGAYVLPSKSSLLCCS